MRMKLIRRGQFPPEIEEQELLEQVRYWWPRRRDAATRHLVVDELRASLMALRAWRHWRQERISRQALRDIRDRIVRTMKLLFNLKPTTGGQDGEKKTESLPV